MNSRFKNTHIILGSESPKPANFEKLHLFFVKKYRCIMYFIGNFNEKSWCFRERASVN